MPASPPTTVVEEVPPKTTPAHAVSLLINTAVGAGVLSLPYAFSCAGWVGGAVVLAAVACLESFTLYVLSRWAESTGACSYGEMVHRTLGPAASATLSLVIFLYLFGSGVAYLVVLGDCLNPLLVHFFGTVWWSSREVAIALVGCTSILPLCFPDNIGSASGISIVNFVAFLAVVLAIVTRSVLTLAAAETPFEGVEVIAPSLLKAVPIAVFSLQCHAQVVAVFNELEDTAELPLPFSDGEEAGSEAQATMGEENKGLLARFRRKRRPKSHKLTTMTRVIVQAIAITAVGYAIVGLAAYMAYPTTIQSNVLNTFAASDPIMQLARFVVAVLEIASYPVNHFPARAAIKDFLHSCTGWQFGGKGFVVAETLIFFLVTLGLALVVHDLGAVFSLVGGTCGSIIILGLPGALLVSYSVQKHRASRTHGEEAGSLATPLLYDTGANGHYNAWSSKHFWGGMALVISCTLLFGFTVVSSLFSSK